MASHPPQVQPPLESAVSALLLVASAGWAWHWHTHPSVFPDAGTGALGVGGGDILADVCAGRTPLEDGTVLDTGSALSQQLVLLVTASRPGVVRTDGVDLTYSHGLQRGTQTIGTDLRIKTGP